MTTARACEHIFEARAADIPPPRVRAGCFVKVCARGERFWCKVESVGVDTLRVIVDNDLLNSPWRCGHELVLYHNHVLEVADAKDRLAFQFLVAMLGSCGEAALAWRDSRLESGAGCRPKQRTCFVVP